MTFQTFEGGAAALRYSLRDVQAFDQILPHVSQRRVCVQAGGNLGVYPSFLSTQFETVYVFEPAADLFPTMTRNAPEANIIRFQAALGETTGMVGTARGRRDGSTKPVHEGLTYIAGEGVIPRLPLDVFRFPTVDLLCLDLEGYELYALRGAAETLQRCRPVVVVEINQHASEYGHRPEEVRWLLESYGYRSVLRVQSDEVFVPA